VEQKEAFEELKYIFTMKLVLVVLDLNKELKVEMDASDYVIGGVLSMCKYER